MIAFNVQGRLMLDELSETDAERILERLVDGLMLAEGFIDPSVTASLRSGEWEFCGFIPDGPDPEIPSLTLDEFKTKFGLTT